MKPKERRIAFCRFRLAITFLRFTGMRANEVAEVLDEQFGVALEHGHLDVLSKTGKQHRYVFTQAARNARKLNAPSDLAGDSLGHARNRGTSGVAR
ncbi:MAG: hypothetical protein AAF471_02390 [Myxococcota bacterium]